MGILITKSDPGRDLGGVANFYARVAPHLPGDARLLVVGKRAGEEGPLAAPRRLLRDAAAVWAALDADPGCVLVVNPSLDARSLLRDAAAVREGLARGHRVVVFVRGWQEHTAALIERRLRRPFAAGFFGASAVIVLSADFRGTLRRWGYSGPVHTATTAIADDAAGAVDEAAVRARCRERRPLRALFMARMVADKGVVEALAAADAARRAGCDLRLTLAGDGPEVPRAARWVNDHGVGGVTFAGHLEGAAKRELMAATDVFVFPSLHGEGMPAAVLEAMAYGQTVVTTAAGGLRDFFADDEHGLVCPDARPATVAARLLVAAGDPALRERLGLTARAYALRHFTAAQAAERLVAVCDAVAADGRRGGDTDWFAAEGEGGAA